MGLQIPPKVVLRKGQVNRDDLVNREDIVAIDLGIDNTKGIITYTAMIMECAMRVRDIVRLNQKYDA